MEWKFTDSGDFKNEKFQSPNGMPVKKVSPNYHTLAWDTLFLFHVFYYLNY